MTCGFLRLVCDNAMQEAKQAVDLIGKWETIDVADALELLSPDFESEEVSYLRTCLCMLLVFLDVYVLEGL